MSAGTLAPRLPVARLMGAAATGFASLLAVLLAIAPLAGSVAGGGGAAPVDAARLDAWMASEVPASPLIGLGGVFVAVGVANGLDPRLLVAIVSVLGGTPTIDGRPRAGTGLGADRHYFYRLDR